jgi:hypothetical protein
VSEANGLVVRRGYVHVVSAFDVGLSIDLARSKQQLSDLTEVASIKHKGHAPTYFQFDPPPLRMTREIAPLEIAARRTNPSVDLTVYDFGGLSVSHTIPFSGAFEDLIDLSCALAGTELFVRDSRRHADDLLAVIGSAVDRATVAAPSEDYLIFLLEDVEGAAGIDEFWTRYAPATARLLRSERDALSEQEIADALATRVSFGREDVAVIDWSAALLVDREPDDVRSVLEFANLQLLEVRILDAALDRALDLAYEVVSSARRRSAFGRSAGRAAISPRSAASRSKALTLFEPASATRSSWSAINTSRAFTAPRVAALPPGRVEQRHPAQARDDREPLPRCLGSRERRARRGAREWIIAADRAEILFSFILGARLGGLTRDGAGGVVGKPKTLAHPTRAGPRRDFHEPVGSPARAAASVNCARAHGPCTGGACGGRSPRLSRRGRLAHAAGRAQILVGQQPCAHLGLRSAEPQLQERRSSSAMK